MSTEIETTERGAELGAPSQAGITLAQQVRDMSDAYKLAEAFASTSFAGPFKGKPQDLAVAILKGNSLGIPAHEVGSKVYVVHGVPAMYGKTALAIAKAHGYRIERLKYGADEVSIKVHSPNGDQDVISYTYARAEKEGLVKGNSAQYKTRPEKMLWWKCVGEAADQIWPHLMSGMPLKEDWEQSEPVKATAERVNSRDLEAITAPQVTDTTPDATPEVDAPEEVMDTGDLDATLAMIRSAQDAEELAAMRDFVGQHVAQHPQDRDTINAAWTETEAAL